MADEGDKVVVDEPKVDAEGKHPETVSWSQYVGIKEKFNRVEGELKGQVTSLGEQLKNAVTPEEHERIKTELAEAKTKAQTATDELSSAKEKTLTEKRATLTKKGIPEDKIKDMSDKELDAAFMALEHSKPNPDLGGGGGTNQLMGKSPMELAQAAYTK